MLKAIVNQMKLQEVVDCLQGTCQTLETALDSCEVDHVHRENVMGRLLEEGEIFCCDACGWWCDTDELHNMADRELCNDCHKGDEESMAAEREGGLEDEDEDE